MSDWAAQVLATVGKNTAGGQPTSAPPAKADWASEILSTTPAKSLPLPYGGTDTLAANGTLLADKPPSTSSLYAQALAKMPAWQKRLVGLGGGFVSAADQAQHLVNAATRGLGMGRVFPNMRAERRELRPANRALSATGNGLVGQMTGQGLAMAPAMLGTGGVLDAALPEATGGLAGLLRLMGIGAGEGAAAGATIPSTRAAQSGAANVALNALLGGVVPPALAAGTKLSDLVGRGIDSVLNLPEAQRIGVLQKLSEILGPNPTLRPPPIEGMPQTLGQATGNPAILTMEKQVLSSPQASQAYAAIKEGAQTAAKNVLSPTLDAFGTEADSVNLAQKLQAAYDASRAQERALWGAIPEGTVAKSDLLPPIEAVQGKMSPSRVGYLPFDVVKRVQGMPDQIPILHVQDLDSELNNEASKAAFGGDRNAASAIRQVWSPIRSILDSMDTSEDPAAQALSRARAFSRLHNEMFETGPLSKVFDLDHTGYPKVDPTKVADILFSPSHPGTAQQALDAMEKFGTGTKQDLRDALMNRFAKEGIGAHDQADSALQSGPMWRYFNARKPIFSALDADGEAQQAMRAIDRSSSVDRLAGTGGSPTAMNLRTQRLIDELTQHVTKPTPFWRGLEGGVLGEATGIGAWPGYIAGRGAGLLERMFGNAVGPLREETLIDALTNPESAVQTLKGLPEKQEILPRVAKLLLPATASSVAVHPQ